MNKLPGLSEYPKLWRIVEPGGRYAHPAQGRCCYGDAAVGTLLRKFGAGWYAVLWLCHPDHHDPVQKVMPETRRGVLRSGVLRDSQHVSNMCPQVVVCAAARCESRDLTVCGPRHGEVINLIIQTGIDSDPGAPEWVLGFVDQDNTFMTREQAWEVADAAGQIRRPTGYETSFGRQRPAGVGDHGPLFSENLY